MTAQETLDSFIIRSYQPKDRSAVREIACDTADHGLPVERFFRDRELVADLLTSYYTDIDPRGVWIAETRSGVAGYLTGALNTDAYRRAMALRVIPPAVFLALMRGTLFHAETWRLIRAGLRTFRLGGHRRRIPWELYPAHFHINLREACRGRHRGRALVERFLQQLREKASPGVHAVVSGDNVRSRRFFERMGFEFFGRQPVVFPEGNVLRRGETIVYVKKLGGSSVFAEASA
jgi:ribosomal protein S18 acetylase RimI-like enzyme